MTLTKYTSGHIINLLMQSVITQRWGAGGEANNKNNRLPRTAPQPGGFVDTVRAAFVGIKLHNISCAAQRGGLTFSIGETGGQKTNENIVAHTFVFKLPFIAVAPNRTFCKS